MSLNEIEFIKRRAEAFLKKPAPCLRRAIGIWLFST
jgi:hypothetical protein